MKTMTMIAAALIASGSFATAAMAQDTKHTLTGQEKTMRYQQDQREKMWNQERLRSGRVTTSNSYGMPNRQNPGRPRAARERVAVELLGSGFGSRVLQLRSEQQELGLRLLIAARRS